MEILDTEVTTLGGATIYGAGNYGDGVYSGGANNYVVFNPRQYEEVWEPNEIACSTDSVSFTTFAVYLNQAVPQWCVGSTVNGNQDTVYLPALELTANDQLIGVWFGGDPGAHATGILIGSSGALQI